MNKSTKTTYFSHFHNTKSANIFNFSLSSFSFDFRASISSIEFRSERSRAWNFRSTFDPSKNRAIFFSSISISILVERVNFRAIRAKFRAILCLVSTLPLGIWNFRYLEISLIFNSPNLVEFMHGCLIFYKTNNSKHYWDLSEDLKLSTHSLKTKKNPIESATYLKVSSLGT